MYGFLNRFQYRQLCGFITGKATSSKSFKATNLNTLKSTLMEKEDKGVNQSNGLGLLIVQRIADMHGASVTTHETPCKEGREVIISFNADKAIS